MIRSARATRLSASVMPIAAAVFRLTDIVPASRLATPTNGTGKHRQRFIPAWRKPWKKISEDLIRERAYRLWEQRGDKKGSAMDFWLQAERQIKEELDSPPTPKGTSSSDLQH